MTRRSIFAVSMLAVLCSLAMTGCGSKDASSSSTTSTTKVTTSSTSSAAEESSVTSSEQESTSSSVEESESSAEESESSAEESESSAEESESSVDSAETSSEGTSDEDSDSAFDPDALMSELQNSDIGLVVSELSTTGTATVDGVEASVTSFGAASSYGDFSTVEQFIYVDGKFTSSNLYVYAGTLSTPEEICDATDGRLSAENFEVVPESEIPCWYVSSAPTGIGCAYVSTSMTDEEAYNAVQEAIVELKELI